MYSSTDLANLREAVKLSPDNVVLRQMLANALLATHHFAEAETTFREALRLQPDNVRLKLGLASAFRQNNKPDAALVLLEELAGHNIGEAHIQLARLYLSQNNADDAFDHYQRAILIDAALMDGTLEEEIALLLHAPQQREPVQLRADEADENPFALEAEHPVIRFADVGGMESVKEEIALKIIFPLTRPELYKAYGKKTGGGILLYGPPGCGKTYLARATAGEINATFLSVGLNDILDMWLGNSERNLHDLFQQARAQVPCVLFFDEVDAIGASRNDMRKSAARTVINQFLDELDGVRYSNKGVLVLAATNSPWYLDSAFRRPGRFDRMIFVGPPDQSAREEILRLHLQEVPTQDTDLTAVAKRTETYSGADLKAVVDRAVEQKLLQALKAGHAVPLKTADLLDAAKAHRPTIREWFASAKNYALYANEAGQYEAVLNYMKAHKWL